MTFSLLDSGAKLQAESVDIANPVRDLSQNMQSAASHAQLEEVLRQCEYFELRGYELIVSPGQQQFVLLIEMIVLILMGRYCGAKQLYNRVHSSSMLSSPTEDKTSAMDILWNLANNLLLKDSPKIFQILERMIMDSTLSFVSEKMATVIRQRLVCQLAISFLSIRLSTAAYYLGYTSPKEAMQYLISLGWTAATTTDDVFLSPPNKQSDSWLLLLSQSFYPAASVDSISNDSSAISEVECKFLTFLEQKRMNT
mmetsp:Transcript_24843/g.35606  ORF Transcript_24843/g.35606 Transcript_24843/m.35606 type:complete len:254 (+) Transcript_24843:50-811(+)